MDGLILGKDVWNLIIEELDSQADRAACSETCFMFWMLVKKGTRKFVCKPEVDFCFKITKLRFVRMSNFSRLQHPSYVVIGDRWRTGDIGVFPLEMVKEGVFESPIVPKPFRFRTLKWKTFSFNGKLEMVDYMEGCQCTDVDLDCQMFESGKDFVEMEDELVIGSMGWELGCYCSIRLLPPD